MTLVTVKPDGTLECLGDLPLGTGSKRRVSTILPWGSVKRSAFRALRALAGSEGRIAAWTRRWQGPWVATILEGPCEGWAFYAEQREDCITWERHLLEANA